MLKGFKQIASLTAVSRVFGMLRDISFAHFFGAGWLMTAWTMGFKVPNLARRLFGEGAASASFIPVYTEELHNNPQQAKQLVNTVVTVLFVLLAVIVLIGEGLIWGYYGFFETRPGPQLGLALCSIMLPYMIFVCIVAILAGILNVHRHFAAPAAAPIVLNIFIITGILLAGWVFKLKAQQQVFFVAVAVLIAGLAQIAIQIPPLRASGVSIRPAWAIHSESFRKIIILMGPMILGLTVTQINTLADDLIALVFMTKQGYPLSYAAPSYLYYAQRLYQVPLGVLGISLATAIFPVMSAYAAKKDFKSLCETISAGLRSIVFIAIPATVGLIMVARPLISVLFQHGKFDSEDTQMVRWTLSFYALGLCGYFAQQVLTRAFYSMSDSRTPMRSALIAVFLNCVLNLTLIWFMGTAGLALSTAICSYLQVVILIVVLRRRLGGAILQSMVPVIAKTVVATILMMAVAITALWASKSWPDIFKLLLVVPSAAIAFLLAAKSLHIKTKIRI